MIERTVSTSPSVTSLYTPPPPKNKPNNQSQISFWGLSTRPTFHDSALIIIKPKKQSSLVHLLTHDCGHGAWEKKPGCVFRFKPRRAQRPQAGTLSYQPVFIEFLPLDSLAELQAKRNRHAHCRCVDDKTVPMWGVCSAHKGVGEGV